MNINCSLLFKEQSDNILKRCQKDGLYRSLKNHEEFNSTDLKKHSVNIDIDYFASLSSQLAKNLLSTNRLTHHQQYNFNSNDYYAIERSKAAHKIDIKLLDILPLGVNSSRLVGGNHAILDLLESQAKKTLGFDQALFIQSGTIANNTIARLLLKIASSSNIENKLYFFSDELIHASIIDGISYSKIAKQQKIIHKHINLNDLYSKIQSVQNKSIANIIFAEGIYSMDGDGFNLKQLNSINSSAKNMLIIDEAYSLGMTKTKNHINLISSLDSFKNRPKTQNNNNNKNNNNDLTQNVIGIYPCGKLLSIPGAIIGMPDYLKKIWINFARSFIYSTAPSPLVSASALTRLMAIELVQDLKYRIFETSNYLSTELEKACNYEIKGQGSQIISIVLKDNILVDKLTADLKKTGIYTYAIKYPTVAKNSARIRLSLHPFLQKSDIDFIVKNIYLSLKSLS